MFRSPSASLSGGSRCPGPVGEVLVQEDPITMVFLQQALVKPGWSPGSLKGSGSSVGRPGDKDEEKFSLSDLFRRTNNLFNIWMNNGFIYQCLCSVTVPQSLTSKCSDYLFNPPPPHRPDPTETSSLDQVRRFVSSGRPLSSSQNSCLWILHVYK